MSGSPAGLAIPCATSMRNPSTPRSSQNRRIRSNSAGTSGLVQSRSGCSGANRCRYHSPSGTRVQAGPPNDRRPVVRRQLAVRAAAGRKMNRARSGCPAPAASAAENHGCWSEKWLGTMSIGDPDAERVRLGEQRVEVGQRAEQRVDVARVGDVVAAVGHRRAVERRQPQRVDAELVQVGQPLAHPDQVTDAVAVAVGEAARVDLVEDRGRPPGPAGSAFSHERHRARRLSRARCASSRPPDQVVPEDLVVGRRQVAASPARRACAAARRRAAAAPIANGACRIRSRGCPRCSEYVVGPPQYWMRNIRSRSSAAAEFVLGIERAQHRVARDAGVEAATSRRNVVLAADGLEERVGAGVGRIGVRGDGT